MGNDAEYHRTFKKFVVDPSFQARPDPSDWNPVFIYDRKAQEAQLRKSREEQYAKKVHAIDAYLLKVDSIVPIRIVAKPDQLFVFWATPWEIFYSTLTPNWHQRVRPVVDEKMTVVGHIGWWEAEEVLIPRARDRGNVTRMLEDGVPVFASTRNPMPEYWHNNDHDPTASFLLLTSVDGAVEAVLDWRNEAGLISTLFPWEYIPINPRGAFKIIRSAAALSGTGRQVVIRILARVGQRLRALASGPTSRAAAKAAASESGTLHSVRIGTFGRPGNLFARIDVEQGRIVYHIDAIVLRGAGKEATAAARAEHRKMIGLAAEEARKRGLKEFTLRGIDANANFLKHADDLARAIGVKGSGKKLRRTASTTNYEVTLKVDKALKSAKEHAAKLAKEAAKQAGRATGRMSVDEMEKYLTDVLAKHPELKRLMAARGLSGEPLQREVLAILREWERAQNWTVKFVEQGLAQKASGRPGNLLWLNRSERTLWVEKQVVQNTDQFFTEVRHELVAHALGGGHGTAVPFIQMANGQVWNAQVILKSAVERGGDLKAVLKVFAGE